MILQTRSDSTDFQPRNIVLFIKTGVKSNLLQVDNREIETTKWGADILKIILKLVISHFVSYMTRMMHNR